MILTYILLICVTVNGLVHGYNVDADLARGLIGNNSAIIKIQLDNGRYFNDYPEDCAAIYLSAKALKGQVKSGIYEIWPREGMFVFNLVFFVIYSTLFCMMNRKAN